MRTRIGVAVAHDAVRAVAVRRGAVVWAGVRPREADAPLTDAIAAVLREAPKSRRVPTVVAAIGPHAAQVKCLEGLPPAQDVEILTAIVRESVGSFFLRNGVPLTTTGVRQCGEGQAWAGVVETPAIDAVRDACHGLRFKLQAVVPTVAVLPLAFLDDHVVWHDGGIAVDITRSSSGLEKLKPQPSSLVERTADLPAVVPALAALGEDAFQFADAYGAAVMAENEELSVDAKGNPALATRGGGRPVALPVFVLVLAGLIWLLSPLGAVWTAHRAETSLEALYASSEWQEMEAAAGRLRPVTEALDRIDAFIASRPQRAYLLGELARRLPDGSALASVEIEGPDGRLTALAPNVEAVVEALRAIPGVERVRVLGPLPNDPSTRAAGSRIGIAFRVAEDAPAEKASR